MTKTDTTNDLRFTATKTVQSKHDGLIDIIVKIRLNDECRNGHEDFAITGTTYKAGKRGNRNMLGGGCIHEDIAKHFPEFKNFIGLHLAQFSGIPMYAVANGFYHLQTGFNNTAKEDKSFPAEFCEYYRIDPEHFDTINVNDEQHFKYMLVKLGIIAKWKTQAKAAIKQLEKLSGGKFKSTATRAEKITLGKADKAEIETRIKEGYYTPKQEAKREKAKRKEAKVKLIVELKADAQKAIDKANKKLEVRS